MIRIMNLKILCKESTPETNDETENDQHLHAVSQPA